MSLAQKISIEDEASAWVREIQGRVSPHRIAAEVGPRCTRLVQRNFRKLGGNAKGWPSTHFYGRAAEATNWQEGFGFVMIGINQIGLRQRLMGGDIKPVQAEALTVPAQAAAYGKTAGEFSNLRFGIVADPETGAMRPALVEAEATHIKIGKKRKDGSRSIAQTGAASGMEAIFWLVKSVHQEPDPRVLPSDEEFEATFDQSVEALLRN